MQEQLYVRLKNCLQTILELEPELDLMLVSGAFRDELEILRMHIEQVERIEFYEEDLNRLEAATARFLEELRLPFERMPTIQKDRLLQ